MSPNLPKVLNITDKLQANYHELCKIMSSVEKKKAEALKKQPVKGA